MPKKFVDNGEHKGNAEFHLRILSNTLYARMGYYPDNQEIIGGAANSFFSCHKVN